MELILVVNSGSSSHKCSLFAEEKITPLWQAHLEWKEGFRDARLKVRPEGSEQTLSIHSHREGLEKIVQLLPKQPLAAIGHRVVHGGEIFLRVTQVNDAVKEKIRQLEYLAPLHNPINLEGILLTETLFPTIPQFAAFDTAFHSTLSEVAATYPIPYHWREKAIRRYGFHGLSHAYCAHRAEVLLCKSGKFIVCHLGAGASLCAVDNGKSVDTTMGMTPLEGLMMASRSGTLDPGLILHLMKNENLTIDSLEHMLNKESGLLGISGISEDMRDLQHAAEKGNIRAQLAIAMFIHRVCGYIGMMLAQLGGLDALIFTAGIGEHSALIRQKTCDQLAFLGLELDQKKNLSSSNQEREISTPRSKVHILVIPTQEEWEINRQIIPFIKNKGY